MDLEEEAMTQHNHSTLVPGCFRCEMESDEEPCPKCRGTGLQNGMLGPEDCDLCEVEGI